MGKQSGKKKKALGGKSGESSVKHSKGINEHSSKAYDNDTMVFISMSQELKDEGNKLFQRRDYEGAMLKYEKALKLLPRNHIDVSYLHSNMAACYMQMGLSEYPRAIHECNLALEVTPKYSKALLKRSRCYEALNRLDLALRDVNIVLKMEPKNLMATEIAERVKTTIEQRGTKSNDIPVDMVPVPEYIEPPVSSPLSRLKEKMHKKRSGKVEEKKVDDMVEENKYEIDDTHKEINRKIEEKKVGDMVEEEKHETETDDTQKRRNGKIEEKKGDDMVQEKKHETETDVTQKRINGKIEVKKVGDMVEDNKHEMRTDGTCKRESGKIEEKKVDDKVEQKKHEVDDKVEQKNNETGTNKKKAGNRTEEKKSEQKFEENKAEGKIVEKKAEDEVVVDVKIASTTEEGYRTVKLVFGEDIRWAQIPINCSILKLRDIIWERFPNSKAVLIKYRDHEGDLVTITTTEELRWAEASTEHGSVRFYIVEVNLDQDPLLEKVKKEEDIHKLDAKQSRIIENGSVKRSKELQNKPCCIDDWIIQFAHLFKNYVGFESDAYLDLHEVGMELYSEAMEETVTSEEAQDIFSTAAEKFEEMAALALFNWGNVHMSRARKKVFLTEDASRESVLAQVKSAYDWAQNEYSKAGMRYEEALKIKPNFYEAILALGQQQFEQAKLFWYYAIGTKVDLESWPSAEVLQLYNSAEENMEKGMQMWEETEEQRLTELSHPSKAKALLKKMKLDDLLKDLSANEAVEQAANMRSQINLLWGTMLYERSIMEFKLGLPVWEECLEVAIEKFELAGASTTDIAVMIKNHCSNDTAPEGLGFNIDEIIQAWNEMYEAKRWYSGIPSFRLEPLLRRRVSKLYDALEHA